VVEVLIEEMFGSDRIRPKDYRRAVVIDAGPKNKANEDTLRSERRSALKKRLTEPTLLEMSGYATNQELAKPESHRTIAKSEIQLRRAVCWLVFVLPSIRVSKTYLVSA
jgi:hypothetical protein